MSMVFTTNISLDFMARETFNGSFRADIMEAVHTSLVKRFVIF